MSKSTAATQTEFVADAFDTAATDGDVERLIEVLAETVSRLRAKIDDDILEGTFESEPGSYVLKSRYSRENQDPEPLTQQVVIEPLLDALGYEDRSREVGDLSDRRGNVADYSVPLDGVETDSARLLIEAEPLNKPLDGRGDGVDQVEDWLSQREFESDFGYATDGIRWVFIRYDPDTYTHDVIERVDLRPVFLSLFENAVGRGAPPIDLLGVAERQRVERLVQSFSYENFVAIATEARAVIREKQAEITDEFYDDYVRYVFGIVEDGDTTRSLVGDGIVAPEGADGDDVRFFAVTLMDRLIFIKFLEDKALVDPTLLSSLADTYDEGIYPDSFYETFLETLFYDVLNRKPESRSSQVNRIDLFAEIPYLNGGLFRPAISEESVDETDFDVRDSVLLSIIDLLEGYEFSADGGPTDLDPSVLGNVFEKTINYLTGDAADQNKELGAYYTPSEITRFCAERTVRPALRDRFERYVIEEEGWPEHAVKYETVYELIDDLPPQTSLITGLLENVVDKFRVVDPACGSGHFLTSVLEEIVSVRKALYDRIEWYPHEYRLKKTTVLENIYGVDIVGPAVEIAKLRCWLSVIAELSEEDVEELSDDDLALPNIDFNLRQGNSLIGYTGFPEQTADGGGYTLETFSADNVRERYEGIITEVQSYEGAIDSDTAEGHRREANQLLEEARSGLIEDIRTEFLDAGVEGIAAEQIESFDPFHWVLEFAEVYGDGGFDAIVGNPPWEVLTVNRDDFFSRYDPTFRSYQSSEKDTVQEELLTNGGRTHLAGKIAEQWEEYQDGMEIRAAYFNSSPAYELQSPSVGGRKIASELDLSALFLERVFRLSRDDGFVALVLPGNVFNGAASKDLRMNLLDECRIGALIGFENHGIFPEIDNRYHFGVTIFENSGSTDILKGIFQQRDLDVLDVFGERAIEIPHRVLADYSPKARIFPFVTSQTEVDVLDKILTHPPLADDDHPWWGDLVTKELHEPTDKGRFMKSEDEGDYPVYGGANIYQFNHDHELMRELDRPRYWSRDSDDPDTSARARIRQKSFNKGYLKKSIFEKFGGEETSKSQKAFVDDLLEEFRGRGLSKDDVLPDYTQHRIGYRNVTNSTNERTMIAAVLPEGLACLETLQSFRPYELNPSESDLSAENLHGAYELIFSDKELFAALGLLNSIPFDFLMRTKIDTHIVKYKLEESQVPRLTEGDDWFCEIWTRAARLNCYGEAFVPMRERLGGIDPVTDSAERREVQAELDAAAFHAYGLDREQTAFVLSDFHRVGNPRVMDEAYFDLVLRKYDTFAT